MGTSGVAEQGTTGPIYSAIPAVLNIDSEYNQSWNDLHNRNRCRGQKHGRRNVANR